MSKVLTPEEVKARFRERGITFTDWANEHGFPRRAVYLVLNGRSAARYGQGHAIAVALGLKPEHKGSNPGGSRNTQAKQAA